MTNGRAIQTARLQRMMKGRAIQNCPWLQIMMNDRAIQMRPLATEKDE